MNQIFDFIEKNRIFTILRMSSYEIARKCADIVIEGGLKIIEVSCLTAGAYQLVKELAADKSLLTGVSSILSVEDIEKAKSADAKFVTLPNPTKELVEFAKKKELFVIGNAMTPTEALCAHQAGVDMVGLYPVEPLGGAKYVRMLLDSFPFLNIRAQGGLNIYNFVDVLDAGATAVGLSSSLFDKKTLAKKDFEIFQKKVDLFLGRFQKWQSVHFPKPEELNISIRE